jgi:hypothetical protein
MTAIARAFARHCEFATKFALANFALSEAIQRLQITWIASSLRFSQ